MPEFRVNPAYRPVADQPTALEQLAEGIEAGERFQTLLGVTGSGKTATMAFAIEQVQRPALVIAHNKTLAAQLCNEFREFFPDNSVEYFVSYPGMGRHYRQPLSRTPTTSAPFPSTSRRASRTRTVRRSAARRCSGSTSPIPRPWCT